MSNLLIFGLGYSALEVARACLDKGWQVTGTLREAEKASALQNLGIKPIVANADEISDDVRRAIGAATHILVSIPPNSDCDPVAHAYGDDIAAKSPSLKWIGYFSSLGVYGNHDGAWVDETTTLTPATARGERRVSAENDWRTLAKTNGIALNIFRLAGIYGPGRSTIDTLKKGTARRIIKPGQVFNRIHVSDIVQVVVAAIERNASDTGNAFEIYNVCDDEPSPPSDVVEFAARLIGVTPPPAIAIEDAGLSPMGMSFYNEIKRVRNSKIKSDLGIRLIYPDYRSGLTAIYEAS